MEPVSGVDPDRDEARRWLQAELRRGDYQLGESLIVRAWRWLTDRLPSLDVPGQLPPWAAWAVLGVVLGAAAAVVAFAARDRWRRGSLVTATDRGTVLEESGLTAADYRRRAAAADAAGDHAAALVDAYRAIAAGAVERALTDRGPGRTAHEISLLLGPIFPHEARRLAEGARLFDAVRYGGARVGEQEAAQVLELERRVRAARPVLATAVGRGSGGPP